MRTILYQQDGGYYDNEDGKNISTWFIFSYEIDWSLCTRREQISNTLRRVAMGGVGFNCESISIKAREHSSWSTTWFLAQR